MWRSASDTPVKAGTESTAAAACQCPGCMLSVMVRLIPGVPVKSNDNVTEPKWLALGFLCYNGEILQGFCGIERKGRVFYAK
jgi:hypothetical protein